MDAEKFRYSDREAKDEVVKMILSGDIAKNDTSAICKEYMATREAIVMGNGGLPRWADK